MKYKYHIAIFIMASLLFSGCTQHKKDVFFEETGFYRTSLDKQEDVFIDNIFDWKSSNPTPKPSKSAETNRSAVVENCKKLLNIKTSFLGANNVQNVPYLYGGRYNAIGFFQQWGRELKGAWSQTATGVKFVGQDAALLDKYINQEASLTANSGIGGHGAAVGIDCSGMVAWAIRNTFSDGAWDTGATAQYNKMTPIAEKDLKPGDFAFYSSGSVKTHIGVYVGKELVDGVELPVFIHSTSNPFINADGSATPITLRINDGVQLSYNKATVNGKQISKRYKQPNGFYSMATHFDCFATIPNYGDGGKLIKVDDMNPTSQANDKQDVIVSESKAKTPANQTSPSGSFTPITAH